MRELYIIIASCIIIFMFAFKGCKQDRIIEDYKKLSIYEGIRTAHWEDDAGNAHAKNKVLVLDKLVLEQQVAEQASLLKLKPKQIKGNTIYSATTLIVKQFDTTYIDNYISILKQGDSIKIALYDTLTKTDYWKRKWFLAPKRYYTDISNHNPYIHIDNIKSLELAPKKYTIFIGPSVTYNPFINRPVVGVSILYAPLTIKF